MIKTDEDALMCDLAETYNIYDYRQLPIEKVAVFAIGLKDSSRIKLKLSNNNVPIETLLLAGINDSLRTLVWAKTKDGTKGKNQPKSILSLLVNSDETHERKELIFESGKDFEKVRQKLIEASLRGGKPNGN